MGKVLGAPLGHGHRHIALAVIPVQNHVNYSSGSMWDRVTYPGNADLKS